MPLVKKWQLDRHEDDSDVHHREWGWADEQGQKKAFVTPFTEQYDWTKVGKVLEKGAGGKFDDNGVYTPCAVCPREGTGKGYIFLFYTGVPVSGYQSIGVARVPIADVEDSTKYERMNNGNPIISDASTHCCRVNAIYDYYETDTNKKWKIWFDKTPTGTYKPFYAYAGDPPTDSISAWTWTVWGETSGQVEYRGAFSVNRLGRLYYCAYMAMTAGGEYYFRACCSKDCTTWNDLGTILNIGSAGEWDDYAVGYGALYIWFSTFILLYAGVASGQPWKIGMSYNWKIHDTFTRFPRNPILQGTTGQWDEGSIAVPSLMQIDEKFYLWYHGGSPIAIGLARIP